MTRYEVTYRIGNEMRSHTVNEKQARAILEAKKDGLNYIGIGGDFVKPDAIKSVSDANHAPLPDARAMLACLETPAPNEKELREGWFRALCIAHAHGLAKDSPLMRRYAEKYGVDVSVVYPEKCRACPA